MNYLTATLLNNFQYYWNSEQTIEEFMLCLNKVRTPPNEAMQKGLDFEQNVQNYCEGKVIKLGIYKQKDIANIEKEFLIIKRIGDIVKDGLWQQEVSKTIEMRGQDFMLFGYADVIKLDTIYDLKRVKQYDIGKYNSSVQHLIYMYCTGIKKFEYPLGKGGKNTDEYYKESYAWLSTSEADLREKIDEFLGFLYNCEEAKEAYFKHWIFENRRKRYAKNVCT